MSKIKKRFWLQLHLPFWFIVLRFHFFAEGITKSSVEKYEVMDLEEEDELTSATGPQRCKLSSLFIHFLCYAVLI